MNYLTITYSIYLVLSILLTIWVGSTLFRHGRIFLIQIFHDNMDLAYAVNKLFLAGFYLVNIGFAVYTLKTSQQVSDTTTLIELLSVKMGTIILILGGMHFFNLFILFCGWLIAKAIQPEKAAKHYRLPITGAE